MAANTTTTTANAVPAPAADTAADGTDTRPATPATPAGVEGAGAAVWGAVASDPAATVPAIATATKLTRAVVKAELASLEALGHVTRTPGGKGDNGRAPETWAPIAPTATAAPTAATDGADGADGADGTEGTDAGAAGAADGVVSGEAIADAVRIMQEEAERRAASEAELRAAVAEEEARRAKVLADLARRRTAEDTRAALADLLAAVTTTYAAVVAGDEEATAAGLERVFAESGHVRRASKAAPARTTGTGASGGGTGGAVRAGRAAPRPLRPEVVAHLNAYRDADFTPAEVAKVLGRSSGAVANALSTAVNHGEAVLTSEHPARYRAAAPAGAAPATGGKAAPDAPESA